MGPEQPATTRRAPARRELGIAVVTVLLSCLALVFSTWDPLWEFLHITDTTQRSSLTLAVSVLLLLVGFLCTVYLQVDRIRQETSADINNLTDHLQQKVPSLTSHAVLTSDQGLAEIANKLRFAREIWNTRIVAGTVSELYPTKAGLAFDKALKQAVRQGCTYHEVLSSPWESNVTAMKAAANRHSGAVHHAVIDIDLPSFVNFIVLDYHDGTREVYLGWAISASRQFEQTCMFFRDVRIANYYLQWFVELFAHARRV